MADLYVYENRREQIGKRIKALRKEKKLTQKQLAGRITDIVPTDKDKGFGQSTISGWERGEQLPPLQKLIALSDIFQCDISYLLCDYDIKKKDILDISQFTGLSEKSVIELCRMYHDNHYPEGVGLGVITKGYVLGHISILDEIIKSKWLFQFLNSLGLYLVCGGILPQNAYSSNEQELTPDEHERFFNWANNRGLEIRLRKDIGEMYLQTACDELKNMFRDILEKELEEHG